MSTPPFANVYVPTSVEISAIDGAVKAPPTLELDEANDSEKEGNLNKRFLHCCVNDDINRSMSFY